MEQNLLFSFLLKMCLLVLPLTNGWLQTRRINEYGTLFEFTADFLSYFFLACALVALCGAINVMDYMNSDDFINRGGPVQMGVGVGLSVSFFSSLVFLASGFVLKAYSVFLSKSDTRTERAARISNLAFAILFTALGIFLVPMTWISI